MTQVFPYKAWTLTPSFNVKEITLVGVTWSGKPWHKSDSGKVYRLGELFPTKDAAIEFGFKRVAEQQAKIDTSQANLNKRLAALHKINAANQTKEAT